MTCTRARAQRADRGGRRRLDRVRDDEHAGGAALHGDEHRSRALRARVLGDRCERGDVDALRAHQALVPDRDSASADACGDSAPCVRHEVRNAHTFARRRGQRAYQGRGRLHASGPSGDDRSRQRMLARVLGRCRKPPHV